MQCGNRPRTSTRLQEYVSACNILGGSSPFQKTNELLSRLPALYRCLLSGSLFTTFYFFYIEHPDRHITAGGAVYSAVDLPLERFAWGAEEPDAAATARNPKRAGASEGSHCWEHEGFDWGDATRQGFKPLRVFPCSSGNLAELERIHCGLNKFVCSVYLVKPHIADPLWVWFAGHFSDLWHCVADYWTPKGWRTNLSHHEPYDSYEYCTAVSVFDWDLFSMRPPVLSSFPAHATTVYSIPRDFLPPPTAQEHVFQRPCPG